MVEKPLEEKLHLEIYEIYIRSLVKSRRVCDKIESYKNDGIVYKVFPISPMSCKSFVLLNQIWFALVKKISKHEESFIKIRKAVEKTDDNWMKRLYHHSSKSCARLCKKPCMEFAKNCLLKEE